MKITHLNHSSLLISEGGCNLLTDPWYFTNAFDGWAPFPQPDARLINNIMEGDCIPDVVLISHAHDDHLDERFLSKMSGHSLLVIPQYASKSLKNRIVQSGIDERNIIEVGTQPVSLFCYTISSISNHTLSREDFIFTIATSSGFVVHANDNWHPFASNVVNHILDIAKPISYDLRYLCAQVGVADSYPIFYSELSNSEKHEILYNKCLKMLSSLVSNGEAIQANHLFAYANQSLFSGPIDLSIDPYLVRDKSISSYKPSVAQLMPSYTISGSDISNLYANYMPLIVHRLEKLSIMFKQFADYRSTNSENECTPALLNVNFICFEYSDLHRRENDDQIKVLSTLHQWNRILSGACNLESIITGGCGEIRVCKSYNMRSEYNLLVDWSYFIQAQIKSGKVFL